MSESIATELPVAAKTAMETSTPLAADPGEAIPAIESEKEQDSSDSSNASPKTVSLSQHLHSELAKLTYDPSFPDIISPFLQDVDAFVSLSGESHAQLPPLDWNRVFRKAYTISIWVRLSVNTKEMSENAESYQTGNTNAATSRKLLYRLSTHPEDALGVGVCVTVGEWFFHPDDGTVSTTLTAFSLPPSSKNVVQIPLFLKADTWQLLSISHVFPYLKRPQWTVSVDGSSMGVADVAYPVLDSSVTMGVLYLV